MYMIVPETGKAKFHLSKTVSAFFGRVANNIGLALTSVLNLQKMPALLCPISKNLVSHGIELSYYKVYFPSTVRRYVSIVN